MAVPTKLYIDHEAGTDRNAFAAWTWTEPHTDHYEVWWEYSTKNSTVWFTGSESSEKHAISQYSYPENAQRIRVRVMPVAENKPGGDTPYWKSSYTKTVYYTVPKSSNVTGRKVGAPSTKKPYLEKGTDRTLRAEWTWKEGQTDYYTVEWQYTPGDKRWYYSNINEVPVAQDSFNAPSNATKVKYRVIPISNVAYESDTSIGYYWISKYSDWKEYSFPVDEDIPVSGAPSKLTLSLQNGTDESAYATWSFSKHAQTDHYEITWQYYTGDKDGSGKPVWYDGGTNNVTAKNATYSIPANAREIRYTVLPVAKELNGRLRFIGKRSSVKKLSDLEPRTLPGTVTSLRIVRDAGNNTNVVASWKWSKSSETDHYEVQWRWRNGTKVGGTDVWFYSGTQTTESTNITYGPTGNPIRVQVRVRPVAKAAQWVANWTPWSPSKSGGFAYPVPEAKVTHRNKKVTNLVVELQSGTDRTLFATWDWDDNINNTKTAGYVVNWQYSTNQDIWFSGQRKDNVTEMQDLYTAPNNAVNVRALVKPVAKTHKVNGVDTLWWTANAAGSNIYTFADLSKTPVQAATPAVSISETKLTAELSTYDDNTQVVEFQIVLNDSDVYKEGRAPVTTNHAAMSFDIAIGGEYKVRARGLNPIEKATVANVIKYGAAKAHVGEWSEYTENFGTRPSDPTQITGHTVFSTKAVQLAWTPVDNVTGYKLEYALDESYFDVSDQVTSIDVPGGSATWLITGLETGNRYFVRVRAVNDDGESGWTPIYSFILGTKPVAPTTWSDSTTGVIGDDLYLYWLHNSEDGSAQSNAEVELTINGETSVVKPTHMATDGLPSYYIFNSIIVTTETLVDDQDIEILDSEGDQILGKRFSTYPEGAVIEWRVRTQGILPDTWSEWSTARTMIVYAQPVINLYVGNNEERNDQLRELTRYPLRIHGDVYPATQKALAYNVSIIANEAYETTDYSGRRMNVRDQEAVYQKYIPAEGNSFDLVLTAGDVNLDSEITYTVRVTAGMDSSLTAESYWTFTARWDTDTLVPDAEVTINTDTLTAYIRPFCDNEDGDLVDDVLLSVYRLEYDGRLTELATGLENGDITIVDPHPSLNYARYRVVARIESTGEIGFRNIPAQYVGETGIVIQWDDEWQSFTTNDGEFEDEFATAVHTGSMLKLPYNIEISDSNSIDVALNEYIGRAHPVSYYGTQLGIKGDWNAVIPRDDIETLYALRRLAIYRGDVYVREPSGVGYWANISVSFSKRYSDMTIPVTLNIVRVEGGI